MGDLLGKEGGGKIVIKEETNLLQARRRQAKLTSILTKKARVRRRGRRRRNVLAVCKCKLLCVVACLHACFVVFRTSEKCVHTTVRHPNCRVVFLQRNRVLYSTHFVVAQRSDSVRTVLVHFSPFRSH